MHVSCIVGNCVPCVVLSVAACVLCLQPIVDTCVLDVQLSFVTLTCVFCDLVHFTFCAVVLNVEELRTWPGSRDEKQNNLLLPPGGIKPFPDPFSVDLRPPWSMIQVGTGPWSMIQGRLRPPWLMVQVGVRPLCYADMKGETRAQKIDRKTKAQKMDMKQKHKRWIAKQKHKRWIAKQKHKRRNVEQKHNRWIVKHNH